MFVYLYKSDSFITDKRSYFSNSGGKYTNTYKLSKDNLLSNINIQDEQGYSIIDAENGSYTLLFIQNLYSTNSKEKLASVVIAVPWENIFSRVEALDQGKVYWINSKDQILSMPDMGVIDQLPYKNYLDENKLLSARIGNQNYVNSFLKSNYYDFKYCISMPKSYYWKEMNRFTHMVIVQIALILLLSTIFALIYSQKIFNPSADFIAMLRVNENVIKERFDLKKTDASMDGMCTENQLQTYSGYQSKEALVNQVLANYVKEWNKDDVSLENIIKAYSKLSLRKPYIAIAVTYQDINECKLFTGIKNDEKEETFQLLKFVFRNIFNEIILSKYSGFICEIDGMHLCIINVIEENTDTLAYDIRKCLDIYKDLLNFKMNVGASNVHSGLASLPKAYHEAEQVLSFQTFWGKGTGAFLVYNDTLKNDKPLYNEDYQIFEKQKKLYNLLYVKEFDKAFEWINQMLEEILIKDIQYNDINQCRLSGLIDTINNCLNDILGKSDGEFLQELQPMKRMLRASSIVSAKHIIQEIFNEIMVHLEVSFKNEHPKWIEEIMDFVDEKYDDPNLNVSVLADKLNMNLSYVSRAFKEYTGYSIMDLIHMKRVEECKKRLILGGSVREAAEMIGYLDSKSLIRVFKKYEGITPGQFKNSYVDVESKMA